MVGVVGVVGVVGHGSRPSRLGEPCNMIESGIIDPTKVTRTAIENAVSVASMLLMTECVVVDEATEDVAAPMPPMI